MLNARSKSGVTLIEVLIAVSLLSLLSVGILFAMRVGLSAVGKADAKLIQNRRVAGTQKILEQQIAGFVPVVAVYSAGPPAPPGKMPFFQGEPQSMRFVSTSSLQEASRGMPQILEFQVIRGEQGRGVRLVVNETVYTGPASAGMFCLGLVMDPALGVQTPRFRPIAIGARSFVLADRLASCHFSYLELKPPPELDQWRPVWILARFPLGIRIEMAALEDEPGSLRPVTITAPLRVDRYPIFNYWDY